MLGTSAFSTRMEFSVTTGLSPPSCRPCLAHKETPRLFEAEASERRGAGLTKSLQYAPLVARGALEPT
jgi:hypothetical protein